MGRDSIGELEYLILLAIAALGARGSALAIRHRLEKEGRKMTRGALYRSLDRLGEKGLLEWDVQEPTEDRGGHVRRVYALSASGLKAIQERRETLERLWADAAQVVR